MTFKTTLSFTDRHHRFLTSKVGDGIFATTSAAVASAIERMIEDEAEREVALTALADEIKSRLATPSSEFLDADPVFAAARAAL